MFHRYVVLFVFALLVTPMTTFAQTTKPDHTEPGSMGWSPFTATEKRELSLTDDQLIRLRDMDDKLSKDYNALGLEPWNNQDFPALNQKRNRAIQDILTPEQYNRWATPGTAVPTTPPTILPKTQVQPAH